MKSLDLWALPVSPPPTQISPAALEFGRRVAARRHDLALSQEKAAENVGVHWTYLGQVERGRRNVTLHNIITLAQGLGIDPAQLVEGLTISLE